MTMTIQTKLALTSPAFRDGGAIPSRHTCDGDDVSPALTWGPTPDETGAWVLIVEDLDARNWVHWLVVNLPADTLSLPEGGSSDLPEGAVEGKTDFGPALWRGPCPPSGEHRYRFSVYALSEPIELGAEVSTAAVRTAMFGRTLGEAHLTGTYRRS
jgi:Raf kinase inhibitor-like YbhB/YbcL family protein